MKKWYVEQDLTPANLILAVFFSPGYFCVQKEKNIETLCLKKLYEEFPDTPSPRYSTKKRKKRDGSEDENDKVDRTGTKNLFLNGWTKEGQTMFNKLMEKIRDDQADYGAAFDSNFMKFCKQMEEDALQKKPKKKKLPESIQIYSEHNIPPRDVANMTQEFMNQVKNTNEEMQQWKCDPLDPNFI